MKIDTDFLVNMQAGMQWGNREGSGVTMKEVGNRESSEVTERRQWHYRTKAVG